MNNLLFPFFVSLSLIFTAIVIFQKYFSSRTINDSLTQLNALHEENLVKETQLTEELKLAREERDAEVQKGKKEAEFRIDEAKKEAITMRMKAEAEAKSRAEEIISQAREETSRIRERIILEMEHKSVGLAMDIIQNTLTKAIKEHLHVQFIDDVIREISELTSDKFSVAAKSVKILSSHPLQESQRGALKKILSEKLGFVPSMEDTVDEKLILGLSLELEGLVIDGTLRSKFQRVALELRKKHTV